MSSDLIENILSMYNAGFSVYTIATTLGISVDTVYETIEFFGI